VVPGHSAARTALAARASPVSQPACPGRAAGRLSAAGPAALTLADACPGNNVRAGGGYVLIDFEEAEW